MAGYFFYDAHQRTERKAKELQVKKERERLAFGACSSGNVKAVKQYLKDGLNPSAEVDGVALLWVAYQSGHMDCVRLLLGAGANPNFRPKKISNDKVVSGSTLLNIAAKKGKLKDIILLLEYKADPNLGNGYGYTPLVRACKFDQYEAAKLLLENGAAKSINRVCGNKTKVTALHFAVRRGKTPLVKLLLKHGADANIHTPELRNPVYHLVSNKDPDVEMLRILLEAGASPNVQGGEGKPLSNVARARRMRQEPIAALLEEFGGQE